MYLRPAFAETDRTRITALIRDNPFGVLVTTAYGLQASHIPFTVEASAEGFVLAGHLAAANPQCAELDGGAALAIFSGPHAYISPSWYAAQPSVPTWDYTAVHVSGRLRITADDAVMAADLQALAEDDPARFALAAMPAAYRARMMQGIRAFRLIPERVEAQWKMSQNRSAEDRRRVAAALRAEGRSAVADLIEATLQPSDEPGTGAHPA